MLTEYEVEVIEERVVVVEAAPEPEEDQAWQSEAPSWTAHPEVEPERPAPRTNGSSGKHHAYTAASGPGASPLEGSSKTLEDSVKDMLRPMLRQWLDENMSRVLTAALKDELEVNPARSQGD